MEVCQHKARRVVCAGTPARERDTPAGSMDHRTNSCEGAAGWGEKLDCQDTARAASTPTRSSRLGPPFQDTLDGSKVLAFTPTWTSHWVPRGGHVDLALVASLAEADGRVGGCCREGGMNSWVLKGVWVGAIASIAKALPTSRLFWRDLACAGLAWPSPAEESQCLFMNICPLPGVARTFAGKS